MKNRVYDGLKFVAQIALPAAGTLYTALAALWELPNPTEVVGTIVAVDFFLGSLLGLSSIQYNNSDAKFDGSLNVTEDDQRKLFSLEIPGAPEVLADKSEIVLKVQTVE